MKRHPRRCALFVALALAVSACEFPGAGGNPNYDFSMAASGVWVVAGGITSVVAFPTWDFRDPHNQFAPATAFTCGQGVPDDGIAVAWGASRFWYVVAIGTKLCLSSAPEGTPFALDRAYLFSTTGDFAISGSADRPFVVVSSNKVAVALDDVRSPASASETHTLVLSLADLLANVTPNHSLILHGNVVRFAPVVGSADDLFFLFKAPRKRIGIGRVTGIPGSGGINTSSTTVAIAPSVDFPVGVLLGTAPWGGTGPTLVIAVVSNDTTLELAGITGLSGTLAPTVIKGARGTIPPLAVNSLALYQMQLSLSATPAGNVLAGFTANGVPWVMVWPFLQPVIGPSPVDTNLTSTTAGRSDFLPLGAAFPDISGKYPGQWFAGVGWIDNTAKWAWSQGQHATFLRDNQF